MSDFPSLCSDCLGSESNNIKMMRQPAGEECKLCTRPFTVFRWSVFRKQTKMNKTIICRTCSNIRNCCQSCMMDLYFRIPLEIRDAALKMAGIENPYVAAVSKNREVKAIMAEKREHEGFKNDEQKEKAKEILKTLAERLGKQKPSSVGSVEQSTASAADISKVVGKLPFDATLKKPSDEGIRSFFVFGFDPSMPQYVVKDYCEQISGPVTLRINQRARCGFVTFASRNEAEKFAQQLATLKISKSDATAALVVLDKKYPVRFCWGSPRSLGNSGMEQGKVGAVVAKVMKQLAEKDVKEGRGKRKVDARKSEPPAAKKAKKVFKAERDIEL
ncbi:hypothetical protein CJI97_001107 [Candidozyma auris]|nr:hypothetical protein CJI97_001107 [[Candida] auris]